METVYRKNIIVELSRCDRDCRMSVPAVFEAFQDIAVEHAEKLGLGGHGRKRAFLDHREDQGTYP